VGRLAGHLFHHPFDHAVVPKGHSSEEPLWLLLMLSDQTILCAPVQLF
jgi:hypothetical protein